MIAALRSRQGASFAIVETMGYGWLPLISVPLIFEYEAIGKRELERLGMPSGNIEALVRAFCFYGIATKIHFGVRPALRDPGDEFLLELGSGWPSGYRYTQHSRLHRC